MLSKVDFPTGLQITVDPVGTVFRDDVTGEQVTLTDDNCVMVSGGVRVTLRTYEALKNATK